MSQLPENPTGIRWASLLGGAVIGWLLSWALFTVAIFTIYASVGGSGGAAVEVAAFLVLFAVAVVSLAVLFRRGRPQWGTGVLLGMAIGSIVGGGVCVGLSLPGM